MLPTRTLLLHLHDISRHAHGDVSLEEVAQHAGQSRFQFHRLFRRLAGETLKQYSLRLRLERAAGDLIATEKSVLSIALAHGFASHEVFTRAFNRYFGTAPMKYRRCARSRASKSAHARQRQLLNAIGPCIRLHYLKTSPTPWRSVMPLQSIERKEIAPLPFLYVRTQASQSELSQALGKCFGIVYTHCMKAGLELAGFPLARYAVVGPLMTIEAGVPLLQPTVPEGEMEYCELPGGSVVFAIHGGPYDQLGDTHAAVLRWMQEHNLRAAGPHWEWYVTDPTEHPDPADWRTHIYYPLAEQ
jgi:AraC family transcriptional regulator